ncbi:MAG: adenylate kinase, partial [Chloroflexi bacterium]
TGREAGRIMAAGDLVPDELIVDIVRSRLPEAETGAGVLLDGFPRTLRQAQALDAMLAGEGHNVDFVLALDVPEQDLVDRLLHRAAVEGRADDTREAIT